VAGCVRIAAAATRNWPVHGPEAPAVAITVSDETLPTLLRQSAAA
jgi:hypothetical protein